MAPRLRHNTPLHCFLHNALCLFDHNLFQLFSQTPDGKVLEGTISSFLEVLMYNSLSMNTSWLLFESSALNNCTRSSTTRLYHSTHCHKGTIKHPNTARTIVGISQTVEYLELYYIMSARGLFIVVSWCCGVERQCRRCHDVCEYPPPAGKTSSVHCRGNTSRKQSQ